MKASEMIQVLHEQIAERGDAEVVLHGNYGTYGQLFEVVDVPVELPYFVGDAMIHIMTDLRD